jgi:YVTN family beta-propeller protein
MSKLPFSIKALAAHLVLLGCCRTNAAAYPIIFIFSSDAGLASLNNGPPNHVDLTITLSADTANLSQGTGYNGLHATVSSTALGLDNVPTTTLLSVGIGYGAVSLREGGQYNRPLTLGNTAAGTLSITLSTGQVLQIYGPSTFQATVQGPVQPGWFDPPNPNPLLPTGQTLTPAGAQVTFPGRPAAVAVHPNSPTAAFLVGESDGSPSQACVNGKTPASIVLVDLMVNAVKQCYSPGGDYSAGFTGLLYNAAGTELYASLEDGAVAIIPVQPDGSIDAGVAPALIPVKGGCPGGLALSNDQNTLYVALNCKNQVAAIDLTKSQLSPQVFPTGNAPWGIVVTGNTAYVTNEGGDLPPPSTPMCNASATPRSPCYNLSAGQRILADPVSGASVSGSVSVIDLSGQNPAYSIAVGLHPTAMLADPANSQLFVANTSSDTVSIIDTNAGMVVGSISVTPFPGAPFGSSPNALAMSGPYLVVSLARNNALEVFSQSWTNDAIPQRVWTPLGVIPTAWFPAGLAVFPTAAGPGLVVANDKGLGSLGPHPGTGFSVSTQVGTASVLSPFTPPTADSPNQLAANNNWTQLLNGAPFVTPNAQAEPAAVPMLTGDASSLIQHVFLVIKENRTYDQVLGDDPKGNGDASLVQFGGNVSLVPGQPAVCVSAASCATPNHHAIADQFVLLDNFFAAGNASADGHQWLTQAYALDYTERLFGTTNISSYRSYPFDGGDSLAYSPTGFLWQNALAHGISVGVYGEFSNASTVPALTCMEWMQDTALLLSGQTNGLNYPLGKMNARSDVPSLNVLLNRNYPGFYLTVPDQYRAAIFLRDLAGYTSNLNMPGAAQLPNLTILYLPDDHTGGVASSISVSAQVSDNDYALGEIVQAISQSPFWSSSAIFVVEDDAQNGTDHVDGHRTVALAAGPYVTRGVTDSTHYTQIDMIRTIEQILGLPPMNQMDLAAQPMYSSFTNTADLTPFYATSPQIPTCGPAAAAPPTTPLDRRLVGVRKAWLNALKKMDFSEPDRVDENFFNRYIWYETKGYGKPYPGDSKVLRPKDVKKEDDDR